MIGKYKDYPYGIQEQDIKNANFQALARIVEIFYNRIYFKYRERIEK